jgi:hypothetical protein
LIQTAQIEIKVADYRAKELAHDLGNPSGDLVRPEIAAWSTGVEKAKQLRASNDSAAAGSTIQGVRPLIGSYLANLDAHAAAPRLLIEQEQKIEDTVLQDESKLARLRLAEARTASENAQDAHARADSSFKTSLNRSKEFLAQAVATSAINGTGQQAPGQTAGGAPSHASPPGEQAGERLSPQRRSRAHPG